MIFLMHDAAQRSCFVRSAKFQTFSSVAGADNHDRPTAFDAAADVAARNADCLRRQSASMDLQGFFFAVLPSWSQLRVLRDPFSYVYRKMDTL
jgi:hypothetical protein